MKKKMYEIGKKIEQFGKWIKRASGYEPPKRKKKPKEGFGSIRLPMSDE